MFQLSRALRVRREIGFEYRLVLRSGTELGVVRLPLKFGERVLDVAGTSGFRVENEELDPPDLGPNGRNHHHGHLANVGTFSPDVRSPYEWWLLESDAEHRITVKGDARQIDSGESPIKRTQSTSRLFLVQREQHIEVSVQPLASVEVLAAVVRHHQRSMVLTHQGDVVTDDSLSYENNGIDYLLYAPGGRTIYEATDGKAERIMQQSKGANDILVPLRTGSHAIHLQTLASAVLSPMVGRLELPMPSYPLTASRVDLSVGLPAGIIPIVLFGGDHSAWFLEFEDLVAALVGLAIGALAVRIPAGTPGARARRERLMGGLVLAGLWFLWPAAFVLLATVIVAALCGVILARLLRGVRLGVAAGLLVIGLGVVGMIGLLATVGTYRRASTEYTSSDARTIEDSNLSVNQMAAPVASATLAGSVVEGVTPVALTLPTAKRTLAASRELVTQERRLTPVLYYVTATTLGPVALGWLVLLILVVRNHRAFGRRAWEIVHKRLEAPPEARPSEPQPPAAGGA